MEECWRDRYLSLPEHDVIVRWCNFQNKQAKFPISTAYSTHLSVWKLPWHVTLPFLLFGVPLHYSTILTLFMWKKYCRPFSVLQVTKNWVGPGNEALLELVPTNRYSVTCAVSFDSANHAGLLFRFVVYLRTLPANLYVLTLSLQSQTSFVT